MEYLPSSRETIAAPEFLEPDVMTLTSSSDCSVSGPRTVSAG
jgi:hypothetical protein